MNDPPKENISGEKRVVHRVNHHINWGYVVLGAGIIFAAWTVRGMLMDADQDESESGENRSDGEPHEIEVEGRGLAGVTSTE